MELIEEIDSVLISDYIPLPANKNQYSSDFIEAHSAIVLGIDDNSVTIGICSTGNIELKEILSHFHE